MHDPKFEKAVQRKMEELEFVPSESVWENIEMAVTPRVRRRAVALYWWFLLPGLLLLGAGTILYKSFGPRVAVNTRVGVQPQPAGGSAGAASQVGGATSQSGGAAGQVGKATNLSGAAASEAGRNVAGTGGGSMRQGSGGAGGWAAGRGAANTGEGATKRGSRVRVGSMETGGSTGASEVAETSGVAGSGVMESRQPYNYRPGLISSYMASLGIRGPRLPAGANNTAVGGIKKPDRSWQAGFTGGIGFSSFNESLLDRISVVSTASTFNGLAPTSANRNVSNYGAGKDYISNIQPNLSFYAGVFAQKPLSSRWSVSVGLNMHYYSSRIRVGQQVNYYVPATSSLISVPAALSAIQPYPSYSTGDDQAFINRYYYLEVPASVEWRINRSRVVPLFWRGGLVLSELMGSNALYYNNQSGVYLKDNGVINHTQLSFSSGLMAALPFRKIRIQAGPEFQYGVTNLLKTASGSGHLFYGGMRLAFMR